MFVGKDVATALGYAKPENAIATHVDADDKTTTRKLDKKLSGFHFNTTISKYFVTLDKIANLL